jgi:hypothetical protein
MEDLRFRPNFSIDNSHLLKDKESPTRKITTELDFGGKIATAVVMATMTIQYG